MFNFKKVFFIALLALSAGAMGQTCPTELVNKNDLSGQIEKGYAIDTYGSFTILGSKGKGNGLSDGAGGALLFNNGQYLRTYEAGEGLLGTEGTVAIDELAIVLASPALSDARGYVWGGVAIAYREGDGYSKEVNSWLGDGSGIPGTGFGSAIAISKDWIIVGAPKKEGDGAVRLFKKNTSTNHYDDKGSLPLPDFSRAFYRKKDASGVESFFVNNAEFGSNIAIHEKTIIVGAKGIGASYIYEQNNAGNWVLNTQNIGSDFQSGTVTVTGAHAAVTLRHNNEIAVYSKYYQNGGNITWVNIQKFAESSHVSSIALDGPKLVVGLPYGGTILQGQDSPHGQVKYYEMDWNQNHQIKGTFFWSGYFKFMGTMRVKTQCSTLGLKNHKLLGYSVAIQGDMIVAGAPNAYYLTVADGGGFRAHYSNRVPVGSNPRMGETEDAQSVAAPSSYFYPNPATDKISISSEEQILNAYATNMNGSKLPLTVNGSQVNIAELPSGMYRIVVTTATGIHTENVVVK